MEKNNCLRCNFRHKDNGNCTAVGGFCTAVQAAHCPLLRQYLDTGLMPEEIDMDHEAAERLRQLCRNCDLDRLEKLSEADKEGRVVMLPCKVGDTVWITGSVRRLYSEKVRTFFCGDPNYSRGMADNGVKMIRTTGCDIPIHKFGKTVFLTREEAEKALEAMNDG